MITTFTRRMTTAIAGSALAAAISAGFALAALTEANAAGPMTETTCSAPKTTKPAGNAAANPLTRAGQLQAAAPAAPMRMAVTTCVGN